MSKLKENIDRILGSSLRCLLPSYWWKRIFGLLVEEIENVKSTANSKATKSEVASLSNSVDALSDKVDNIDSGNNITVDSSLSTTSTNPVQNKVVTEAIKNVVPTFGITKTQGFAEYFLALIANQSNPNMYPRGIVLYEDSQSEVDNVLSLNNRTEVGIEFNVADKRYRWVFNKASGMFIREEEVSSEGGLETRSFKSTNSTTDKEWNKETISLFLEGKVSIVYPYPAPNGVLPEGTGADLMPNTHIYQNGTHQFWFTEQHPSGGYTDYGIAIQSDGTYDDDIEVFKPDTHMSDTSNNLVQNKVIKAYVDDNLNDLTEEVITNEDIASAAFAELSSRIDSQVASLKRTTSQNLISQVENLRSSLTEIIIDDEDVVAAALAEQSQRIDSKTDRLERVKATRNELAVQVESILSTILENEDIISAALAEINGRIEHIEEVLKKKLNRVNYEIS